MALPAEDVLAIQQLYARYNHAIDSGNAEAWADCFTDDATFDAQPVGPLRGRDALIEFARNYSQNVRGRHWTNNLLLEEAEGGARGTCYLILFRLGEGGATPWITGIYRDELTREDNGWRFTSRTMTSDA
ncbi:MAG: hypothetical protein Kow0010_04360 [Dehalococcoidia bacterium]